jgi:GNAT superfamily N-acetyltransferase
MFEYLSYILCFGILIIFIIYIYIRIKYGFWVQQPVYHTYDFGKSPGIIDHSLPTKNKYTNFREIDTIIISDLTSIQRKRFINLIKANYSQNKDNIFSPQSENIMPYFIGHNDKPFISFFYKDDHMLDLKKGNMITDRKIIGSITSRPLHILINNGDKDANFYAYYADYLCVDKLHRKKGIAPQLIQTHHYNQRQLNKNIVVSLFKREGKISGIVPLCVYSIYGFQVDTWTRPSDLSGEYKLLEINQQNFRFLYDFIRTNSNKFDIVISVEAANIIELIKTKNIFVYVILCDKQIISCYFFRKSCVQNKNGLYILKCFASICNCEMDVFIHGFKISFWKIAAENYFGFASIENLSHNDILINNIIQKTSPTIIRTSSYYFYNFAYKPFKPEKCLIIT